MAATSEQLFDAFPSSKTYSAVQYFQHLHQTEPSKKLKEFLSIFAEPKSSCPEVFAEGVKKFMKLADSNALVSDGETERNIFYGNPYFGLHYCDDLFNLWNLSDATTKINDPFALRTVVPKEWDSILQGNYNCLVYKGNMPSDALDNLLKGPSVIDCGMFIQLALWFGIRYLLGNKRFNQCFGHAPFFITPLLFDEIKDSDKPYSGNPLSSFLSNNDELEIDAFSIVIKYLINSPLYPFKHPGGADKGQNCIVINNQYYLFDLHLKDIQGVSKATVLDSLRKSFNQKKTASDMVRLSLFAKISEEIHPFHGVSYAEMIEFSHALHDHKITKEEFRKVKQDATYTRVFDLEKLMNWLQRLERNIQLSDSMEYCPLAILHHLLPETLLEVIPSEKKLSMDFSHFRQDTPQQKTLISTAMHFCQSVLDGESRLVALVGKSGAGKAAAAVCAAKELAARGKNIVWVSDILVHGWINQASVEDKVVAQSIDRLLEMDPDAVFFDDDDLTRWIKNLLFEKIYAWYVHHSGKGFFLISSQPIDFTRYYGYQFTAQGDYVLPPFVNYHDPQYINQIHKTGLSGNNTLLSSYAGTLFSPDNSDCLQLEGDHIMPTL